MPNTPEAAPTDDLTVVPLGEDGDSYLVQGTDDVVLALAALRTWWKATVDGDDEEAERALSDLDQQIRTDWWWQDVPEPHSSEMEIDQVLRRGDREDPWHGYPFPMPDHTTEPTFAGVLFA